jgi:hypothetical protein
MIYKVNPSVYITAAYGYCEIAVALEIAFLVLSAIYEAVVPTEA